MFYKLRSRHPARYLINYQSSTFERKKQKNRLPPPPQTVPALPAAHALLPCVLQAVTHHPELREATVPTQPSAVNRRHPVGGVGQKKCARGPVDRSWLCLEK